VKRHLVLFACVLFFTAAFAQDPGKRIDFLLDKLTSAGDFKVRIAAAQELGKIGDGTVADWMLSSFRKEKNGAVRLAILSSIGKIPDERILPPLVYLTTQTPLQESELLVVEQTLWTFRGAIDAPSWEKTLTKGNSAHERGLAAWILGLSQNSGSIKSLYQGCKDNDASVRAQSYRALGLLGSSAEKDFCSKGALQEQNPSVKQAATNCNALIDAIKSKRLPANRNPLVQVNQEVKDIPAGSFGTSAYRQHLAAKQPRPVKKTDELLAAVENLRENGPEIREERSVPIMESQEIHPTMRMKADASGDFDFYAQDIAVLRATMKSRAKNIDDCYLDLLRRKIKIEGDLKIAVTVAGSGQVNQVDYLKNSLDHRELRACVSDVIKKTSFPNTGFKQVTVNYQFTFIAPKNTQLNF